MKTKKIVIFLILCIVCSAFCFTDAFAGKSSLNKWKPSFNSRSAKYKCIVSNVSHPAIKGVYAGFAIRDELWKRSKGRIFLDYKPFAMLGGEVEVLNQLQMGAIQGMACSSVASTNLGPRFGVINLPYLVNSFEKLDKFISNKILFNHFLKSMEHQGIIALDVTGYGNYGWASTIPVTNITTAKKVKFRTAEAAVNQLIYKSWGFNAVVMPWPDVPIALKQRVIDGLDHTPVVCSLTKKFEVCSYFTQINYAQGLFIWLFNKRWFKRLPSDLQKIFKETVRDVCAEIREQAKVQEQEQIKAAKTKGIKFFRLSEKENAVLKEQANAVHIKYADEINMLHKYDRYRPKNYLKKVQTYMGYKP